jgi:hypothetical protein
MQRTVADRVQTADDKYLPKDTLTLEFNPDQKLAHFVVELRNVPGALERSAALATRRRVNILSGFHHAPSASERAFWSFFADFTDAVVDPSQLAKELGSLASTEHVRLQVPGNGLLMDAFHFPMRWGGKRATMMRTESMGSMFSRINGIFGDGPAAEVILYEMGEAAGRAIYDDLAARIRRDTIKGRLSQILALYSSSGWGVAELLRMDFHAKATVVRIHDNFECVSYQSSSAMPSSNCVRGHLAEWFSQLFHVRG